MVRRYEAEIKLRLSEKLRRKIERAAARNNRSMNTEILDRLEVTFGALAAAADGAAAAQSDFASRRRRRARADDYEHLTEMRDEYLTEMRDRLDALISAMVVPVVRKHGGKQ